MDNKRPGGSMKQPLGDVPTRSQILPLQTNWRAVMAKGYFWPGIITVLAVIMLFSFLGSDAAYTVSCYCKVPVGVRNGGLIVQMKNIPVAVPMYLIVLALYITAGLGFAAYRIIGKTTPLWIVPAVAAVTYFLTDSPMVLRLAHLLDFGVNELGDSFSPVAIVQGFFAAGLPEEALKAIPVGLGVWAAKLVQDRNQFLWPFRVVEPLDGILIGVASGLGFTLCETLTQYVPQQIVWASFNLAGSHMAGQLLIPRILQNIAGHAAWAGIFGYYIGLAALRPASWKRLVPIGLCIAAGLHGAWDGTGGATLVELIVAVASFALFAGVVMKARELSPNRSQLIRSQVLETAAVPGGTAQRQSRPTPSPSQATPGGTARSETWGQRSETWGQRSETWDDAPRVEHLEVAGKSIPLTVGARLTESQIPALTSSAGDTVVAIVAANPDDPKMLGLKNLSTETWRVETVGRGTRELASGRSIRIERGVRIQLGNAQGLIK
jgi:RsiW-degrading membrane proteinase PrsW (M82 family)